MQRKAIRAAVLGLALAVSFAPCLSPAVTFAVRAQTGSTDVRYYRSGVNDGNSHRTNFVFLSGGTAASKGSQHVGDHDYSGGQFADAILSDGLIASVQSASSDDCVVWNPSTGVALFTNNLGGISLSFRHIAPMPMLKGLIGGNIPKGSLAAYRATSWGSTVAVFERHGTNFTTRFNVSLGGGTNLWAGLTANTNYWGSTLGNVYIAAALKNGTILVGVTGNRSVHLFNPATGAESVADYSTDIDWLQGVFALPSGEIGLVGANRKVRLYNPEYSGAEAPVLGPVVGAVDLPDTHGAWVTDATAFIDGTIGVLIGRAQYPAGDGRRSGSTDDTVDVLQRWTMDGRFLESLSTAYNRAAHIAGDSALTIPAGTLIMLRSPVEPKPVALVGSSYGRYEVKSLIKNAVNISPDLEYVFEDRGESLPGNEFRKYGLVILATSVDTPMTLSDSTAIYHYLLQGGHVLIIHQAGKIMAEDIGGVGAVDWFGMEEAKWWRTNIQCQVREPAHPLLDDVFTENPAPSWLTGATMGRPKPTMQNIIGNEDGYCLFGLHDVGRGWLAYLGHELFRLRSSNYEDSWSYIALLRNIIAHARPLTNTDLRQDAIKEHRSEGRDLLIWNREWQAGEPYGPRFSPPLPSASELITSLSADMVVNEIESLQINVTPLFSCTFGQVSMSSTSFPPSHIETLVQDEPDAIPWPNNPELAQEFPYWLMPPSAVAPKGSEAFTVERGQTRTLWIRIDSAGVAPGDYSTTLSLSIDGGTPVEIPLTIRIHPVHLPRKRSIVMGPGGLPGDVVKPENARRLIENIGLHGGEWTRINAVRMTDLGIVGESGTLGTTYFTANRPRFEIGDFPMVDFAAFDPWFFQSFSNNLTHVRVGDIGYYLRGPLGQAGFDTNTQIATEGWLIRELSRYLRHKGFRHMVTSKGDEYSESELITAFLPWAEQQTSNGWDATTTFTGLPVLDPTLNADLAPVVGLWTLNRGLMPSFVTGVSTGGLTIRSDAVIGTYGAGEGRGSEHRKALSESRFLGWESWMWGVEDCYVNPYFKSWLYYVEYVTKDLGIAGERYVSYLDKDDLTAPMVDCPFWDGVREGLEEGNLCHILDWHLDRLETVGGSVATNATRVRGDLDAIMGSNETALIRWTPETTSAGLPFRRIVAGNEDFREGKRKLLDLFSDIRSDALAHIQPSLYWQDVPLIKEGVVSAAVYVGSVGADSLLSSTAALLPSTLPVFTNAPSLSGTYSNAIVIGNGGQNALAGTLLAGWTEDDATTNYPGPGSYFIKQNTNAAFAGGTVLLIAGPNAVGTELGVALFSTFLRSEGNELRP